MLSCLCSKLGYALESFFVLSVDLGELFNAPPLRLANLELSDLRPTSIRNPLTRPLAKRWLFDAKTLGELLVAELRT